MLQIKLAAVLIMPLAVCSISAAQEQHSAAQEEQPNCTVKWQPPTPHKDEVYGTFVPYTGPLLGLVPQKCEVAAVPTAGKAPVPQAASRISSGTAPAPTLVQPKCEPPPTPREDEVYGTFVPYTGPLLGVPPRCEVAAAPPAAGNTPKAQMMLSDSPPLDLSAALGQPPDSAANSGAPSLLRPAMLPNAPAAIASAPSTGDPAGTGGYVRPIPTQRAPTIPQEVRPFRSLAIGFKADTLGLGVEFATPMAYRLNLRSSVNFFAFNDPFNIDGVDYNARLHFKSSETTVDWFPRGEGGFHISPGILYVKNTLSAPASVGPGQSFVLGTQTFVNSVDDPVNGSSSVVYARKFAPLLLLGYGNIIPRTRRHLSFPVEFGVAYTGAPQISVALNGTACTTNGCVDFATNAEAQKFLKQEINILNEDLKKYPVFPIVSVGVAYHF